MEYKNLLVEQDGPLAIVTINRPQKMNALSHATFVELDDCFHQLAADDDLRAVILTGAGEKAFVAGADISELAEQDRAGGHRTSAFGQAVMNRIEGMQVPVVAAVMGFALGGGCELALCCHMRVAHASARFGQPEVNLGLVPGYGGTQRLPRLVGQGRAIEICLRAGMVKAEEAKAIGLVNEVVSTWRQDEKGQPLQDAKGRPVPDREAFLQAVRAWIAPICEKAPLAVAGCLQAIGRGMSLPLQAGLELEQDLFGTCFTTEDMREGTSAFLEKRAPQFKSR